MTAPAFKGIGTRVSGSSVNAVSPTLAIGDIALGFAEYNSAGTLNTPSGWTLCAGCPITSGGIALNVYWQRASFAGSLNFPGSYATGSGNIIAVVTAYSGCITSGDPTEAGTGQSNAASTTVSIPAITTLGADRLVVLSGASVGAIASNISNATLAGLATHTTQEPQIGDGSLANAGSSGQSSFTIGSSVASVGHAIALKPAPSDPVSGTSALGALATVATLGAALVIAGSCGLGGFGCGGSVAAANTSGASNALPVLATAATANGNVSAAGTGTLAALEASGTVIAVNFNNAAGVSSLGALQAAGTANAASAGTASSTLGLLQSAGQTNAGGTVAGSPALPSLFVTGLAGAINPANGSSSLGVLASSALATQSNAAAITATLGALESQGTVTPTGSSYPLDPRYYVQIAPRPFYVSLPDRPFYAAVPARPFYILSNPNMTPSFDTKDPRETVVLTFDASADLADGETLTGTPSLNISVVKGSNPATDGIISDPVINDAVLTVGGVSIAIGHAVQAIATSGNSGCTYLIAFTCTTSNPDKVLTLKGLLPVSAQ